MNTATFDDVRTVIVDSRNLHVAPADLSAETALFGTLPELGPFGVVTLVGAFEDDEFGAELVETVGSVTTFVDSKLT